MPTKKIADLPKPHNGWAAEPKKKKCLNPEHDPPMMRVFEPGVYEHTCPGCGHVTSFTIQATHMTEDIAVRMVERIW